MKKKNILLIILLSLTLPGLGQIKGNGKIETLKRSLALFSELEVNFPAKVIVNCKSLAQLEIVTDENIFEGIEIRNAGGKLSILQEKWISPTQITITIGVPFLSKLTTGGYGDFYVNNLEGSTFYLDNAVGNVHLAGQVERLEVEMNKGYLDALKLETKEAYATFDGYGEMRIHVSEYYEIKRGTMTSSKRVTKPGSFRITKKSIEGFMVMTPFKEDKKKGKVERISLKLHNNQASKVDLYIQGPEQHPFSYGISIQPFLKRKENFPLGTEIYLDKILGKELLYTVQLEDRDQVVKLFNR